MRSEEHMMCKCTGGDYLQYHLGKYDKNHGCTIKRKCSSHKILSILKDTDSSTDRENNTAYQFFLQHLLIMWLRSDAVPQGLQ